MRIARPERRLEGRSFWREVDAEHNRFVAERLPGRRVLDIGCGYGSLTNYLCRLRKEAIGIDSDAESIRVARELFAGHEYLQAPFEGQFPEGSFDHVALRDALHHLYEEGDIRGSLREIKRVLKPDGTLVIFDPNVQFLLRLCRRIMRHADAECSVAAAWAQLDEAGFKVCRTEYFELFALAASGGYVGICWVPPVRRLHRALIMLNRLSSTALGRTPLARLVLWRYCIIARPR